MFQEREAQRRPPRRLTIPPCLRHVVYVFGRPMTLTPSPSVKQVPSAVGVSTSTLEHSFTACSFTITRLPRELSNLPLRTSLLDRLATDMYQPTFFDCPGGFQPPSISQTSAPTFPCTWPPMFPPPVCPSPPVSSAVSVCLKGLRRETTEASLTKLAAPFGHPLAVRLLRRGNASSAIGIVCMPSRETGSRAALERTLAGADDGSATTLMSWAREALGLQAAFTKVSQLLASAVMQR